MASSKEKVDVNEPCKEPAALSSAHEGHTRKRGKRQERGSSWVKGRFLATLIKHN